MIYIFKENVNDDSSKSSISPFENRFYFHSMESEMLKYFPINHHRSITDSNNRNGNK